MKLKLFIITAIVLSIMSWAADYAIILKTLANPFWVDMKKGIEEEATKQGVQVEIFSSRSDSDTESQLRLFEDLLSKKYKAIAFAPISGVNVIQPAVKAYKNGIYLVNIDEVVDLSVLQKSGANVFSFITTDNVAVGGKAAQYIIDKVAKGSEVAIVEGKSGSASGEDRRDGAKVAFAKAGLKLVASQPGDWDRTRALNVAQNMIQRFPNIKAIYCANDTMALGVQQAVNNSGKKIIVVGTDGTPEAREMVSKSQLAATIAQDPAAIGATSLKELIAAVKGGKQIRVNEKPKKIFIESKVIQN